METDIIINANAVVINIGDEILAGHTLNTNAQWLSRELTRIGMNVVLHTVVPDEAKSIVLSLENVQASAHYVFITGGLGPTGDDRTKSVLCEYFGDTLEFREDVWREIRERFRLRGRILADINRDQAMLPVNAGIIPNSVGTARGIIFRTEKQIFYVMPGVPAEMKSMMKETLLPHLANLGFEKKTEYQLMTFGAPESQIAQVIQDKCGSVPRDISLGFYPSLFGVILRINSFDSRKLADYKERLKSALGKIIYSDVKLPLAEIILQRLKEKKITLTTAESCTGGLISDMLTDIPGCSEIFLQGFVTYDNDAKIKTLGVRPETIEQFGAVSEETVREMTAGACRVSGADVAIAVSGIAGPGGGSREKPVGTVWLAAGSETNQCVKKISRNLGRHINKEISAHYALHLLREYLDGLED